MTKPAVATLVLQLAGGSRFLRFEDLASSDGPDLHVWPTADGIPGRPGIHTSGRRSN
ncbi:MAG: hypothetical protein Q8O61_17565 [Nocardioides sp.]|nr:hypothetical protein [Nocardioides sp.]